jgi:hyperosmotically inducible periplasmic protein
MKKAFGLVAFLVISALSAWAANSGLVKQGPTSTSQLDHEIQQELLLLPGYTVFDNIDFELKGTTVRLTGEVTQDTLKQAAEEAVKELPGVRRVVNSIEVLPSSSVDNQIRIATFRAIYNEPAFRAYASQSVQSLRILVQDGCLTLEGTVANETDRQAAYRKALAVPGVLAVSNRLRVTS